VQVADLMQLLKAVYYLDPELHHSFCTELFPSELPLDSFETGSKRSHHNVLMTQVSVSTANQRWEPRMFLIG